jgi:hypothetical protein
VVYLYFTVTPRRLFVLGLVRGGGSSDMPINLFSNTNMETISSSENSARVGIYQISKRHMHRGAHIFFKNMSKQL